MDGGRTGVALLVVGALLLAGCAGGQEPLELIDDDPGELGESELFNADRGAISGLVVDESVFPVGNASVLLHEGTREGNLLDETMTAADGRFTFPMLEPGTYRVLVETRGFAANSLLAQVLAGDITRLQFTMGSVASKEPYVELLVNEGLTGCSLTAVWLVLGLPCGAVQPNYVKQFKIPMAESWRYAAFEANWETRDAIWMFAQYPPSDTDTCLNPGVPCPGSVMGTPPIRFDGAPDSANGTDQYQWGDSRYPPEGETFDLYLNFSDFGMFYDELNNYGAPVCDLNGYCGGVGTALEIRYTSYVSIFHYSVPLDSSAYSAIPDS